MYDTKVKMKLTVMCPWNIIIIIIIIIIIVIVIITISDSDFRILYIEHSHIRSYQKPER
jgi:hypothetical protein